VLPAEAADQHVGGSVQSGRPASAGDDVCGCASGREVAALHALGEAVNDRRQMATDLAEQIWDGGKSPATS
jgi:hypothetical protein